MSGSERDHRSWQRPEGDRPGLRRRVRPRERSISDLGKGRPAPVWASSLKVNGGFGTLTTETILEHFAPDVPKAQAKVIASKQGPIAVASFDARIAKAAWQSKTVRYLLTSKDHMIAPDQQAGMAKRMNAKVTEIPASHVVMISKPKEVAKAIIETATASTARASL